MRCYVSSGACYYSMGRQCQPQLKRSRMSVAKSLDLGDSGESATRSALLISIENPLLKAPYIGLG